MTNIRVKSPIYTMVMAFTYTRVVYCSGTQSEAGLLHLHEVAIGLCNDTILSSISLTRTTFGLVHRLGYLESFLYQFPLLKLSLQELDSDEILERHLFHRPGSCLPYIPNRDKDHKHHYHILYLILEHGHDIARVCHDNLQIEIQSRSHSFLMMQCRPNCSKCP